MAGSDREGTDQSTLDERTRSTVDGEEIETTREDATDDGLPEQDKGTTEEGTQRSIRDMLDDEGEASVFINRDSSSRIQSSTRSASSAATSSLNPLSHF